MKIALLEEMPTAVAQTLDCRVSSRLGGKMSSSEDHRDKDAQRRICGIGEGLHQEPREVETRTSSKPDLWEG